MQLSFIALIFCDIVLQVLPSPSLFLICTLFFSRLCFLPSLYLHLSSISSNEIIKLYILQMCMLCCFNINKEGKTMQKMDVFMQFCTKMQFKTKLFTMTVIFTNLFWQPQLPNYFCKNNRIFLYKQT